MSVKCNTFVHRYFLIMETVTVTCNRQLKGTIIEIVAFLVFLKVFKIERFGM